MIPRDQQPRREPDPEDEFIILWEDVRCLADYFRAALNRDEPKSTLIRMWDQEVGVIRTRPHAPAPLRLATVDEIKQKVQEVKDIAAFVQTNMQEHDASVAQAATLAENKRVLDSFEGFIDAYSREDEDGHDYVSVLALQNHIESLRHSTTAGDDPK